MIISRSIILRMRNVSGKVAEKVKARIMISNFLPNIVPFVR